MTFSPRNRGGFLPDRPRGKAFARTASVLVVCAFVAILLQVYLSWLAPTYGYLGFTLNPEGYAGLWLSLPVLLITAAILPTTLEKFSDFFMWMLYFFLFTPVLTFMPLQWLPDSNIWLSLGGITISFHLMNFISRYDLFRFNPNVSSGAIKKTEFFVIFSVLYGACLVYMLVVFGGNLRVVTDFGADVYKQRAVGGELSAGSLVGYASGIFSGALNPFLLAIGLTERRKLLIVIGFVGMLLAYATAAIKGVLISAVLIPAFYISFIRHKVIFSYRLGLIILISCIIPWILLFYVGEIQKGVTSQIVALVFMRAYGIAGIMTGIYADFFVNNPHTYYSHINLVSVLIPYPYRASIGEVIAATAMGLPEMNANASFWATDGFAAAGIPGVILMGGIIGLLLSFANAVLASANPRIAFLASLPFVMYISNSSFFSSVLTGGGGLLVLLIYLWQKTEPPRVRDRSRAASRGGHGKFVDGRASRPAP